MIACILALAGCGTDQRADCASSPLTYETFGEPFVTSWCRGCHSSDVPPTMRQDAPLDVNFDTLAQVRAHRRAIHMRAGIGLEMPPAGGPSSEERELLVHWLSCGAP